MTLVFGDFNDTNHPGHRIYDTSTLYTKLSPLFRSLGNPLVGYFVDKEASELFLNSRNTQQLNYMTKTHQLNKTETWTYALQPHFKRIISSSNNTISQDALAEHVCFQHLKYELLQKSLTYNPFCTKYFAWVDLTLLVDLTNFMEVTGIKDFRLHIPNDLDIERVGFMQLDTLSNISTENIFKQDKTWLCTDIFFGKRETMKDFVSVYMQEMVKFLDRGLGGSDNNVLYALNMNDGEDLNIKLQVYDPVGTDQRKCLDLLLLLKQSGDKSAHVS